MLYLSTTNVQCFGLLFTFRSCLQLLGDTVNQQLRRLKSECQKVISAQHETAYYSYPHYRMEENMVLHRHVMRFGNWTILSLWFSTYSYLFMTKYIDSIIKCNNEPLLTSIKDRFESWDIIQCFEYAVKSVTFSCKNINEVNNADCSCMGVNNWTH